MDKSGLNRKIEKLFEGGMTDPYDVAEAIADSLDKLEHETVLRIVLPAYTRIMAGRQRRKTDGLVKPVFVPSRGWSDMSSLTSLECREVASEYRKLADQNAAMAEEFEAWADNLDRHGAVVLGDLAEFKSYMSMRTRQGMLAAKAKGRKMGRPVETSKELNERIVLLRKTMTLQQVADLLNSEGVKTATGKTWGTSHVFKATHAAVARDSPVNPQ